MLFLFKIYSDGNVGGLQRSNELALSINSSCDFWKIVSIEQ